MYWLVTRDTKHKVCTVTLPPFLLTGTRTDFCHSWGYSSLTQIQFKSLWNRRK